MQFRKLVLMGVAGTLAALTFGPATAQETYPSRPVEFIVPWGPGGGADQLARLVGKLLEPSLDQGVPVVNVPGGTGATGMAKLLAAPADGYSMAIYIADSHALLAGKDARWTMEDITPAAVMIQAPSFLFVPADSPYETWADFEAAAKAEPDQRKVATLGFGSVDDFTLSYLASKGIKVNQVPFSKPSERYISILGGHADALYEQAGDVAQLLNSGQIRPLIIFGEERSKLFPDVPSSYELGYEIALPQFRAIALRSGTPPERVKILSDALAEVAASPDYKKFLGDQYASEDSFLGADQALEFVKQQLEDMKSTVQK
ncbi:tripartite tricarboxylate transporter substrate binding protein [Rhodospirillaceae bacterium SYSU D60014]|uniref:tripartite tricarboxylate transporter substrate binding protein n=1 Tax=Virgifigura deserti TaxID=2268457 RepID=UPI000E66BA88